MPGKVLGRLPLGRLMLGRLSAGNVEGRLPEPMPVPEPGRSAIPEPAPGRSPIPEPEPGFVLGRVEGRCTDGLVAGSVLGRELGVDGRLLGVEGRVVGAEGRVLGRLSEDPVVGLRDPLLGRL